MSTQRFDPTTRIQDLAGMRFQTPGGPWRPLVVQSNDGQWQFNPHAPVTSGFGNRVHPVSGRLRHHNGVDFGLQSGTRLAWKGEGNIQSIKDNPNGAYGGYGNLTLFQPAGADFSVKSAHLNKLPMGNLKSMGLTDLGFVGTTGTSTGPHLHLEVLGRGLPGGQTQIASAPAQQQRTPQQESQQPASYNINIDLAGLLSGKNQEDKQQVDPVKSLMDGLLNQALAQAMSQQQQTNYWDLG